MPPISGIFVPSSNMKQITATILAILVFAVSAKDVLLWASFKANQDFIAKTLCINRDQPEKKCNGKCQLTKKIAESKKESPEEAPVPQPDEQKQVLNCQAIDHFEINPATAPASKPRFAEDTFTAQSCATDIFQPPKASRMG